MKATTVATLFTLLQTTTSFNPTPETYGRHSHGNTASYNSLRDMAAYPETFDNFNNFNEGGGDWRRNSGYSQGPGGYRDMETNPYYDEGWSQSARPSRGGGGPMMGGAGGPMMGGGAPPRRSADGFDPFGAYSPAMGMSRSDRRMDRGDLFMNSDAMGMRSDRTMRGFTYDGRNREYGSMGGRSEYGMDVGMMYEDPEFGPPPMGMMGGDMGGMMGGGMGRMGP